MWLLRALVVLAALWASPGEAAFAYVGGATSTGTGNAVTRSVTANNLLLVGVHMDSNIPASLSISDGVNTWNPIDKLQDNTNGQWTQWWYAVAATTASITVTITPHSGSSADVTWIAEYSGNSTTTPLDQHALNDHTGSAGSTAADGDTAGPITPTVNNCLIVGWINPVNLVAANWATPGGSPNVFTERANSSLESVGIFTSELEDFSQGTAASISATWTAGDTSPYAAYVASFKPSGGAATAVPQRSLTGVGL